MSSQRILNTHRAATRCSWKNLNHSCPRPKDLIKSTSVAALFSKHLMGQMVLKWKQKVRSLSLGRTPVEIEIPLRPVTHHHAKTCAWRNRRPDRPAVPGDSRTVRGKKFRVVSEKHVLSDSRLVLAKGFVLWRSSVESPFYCRNHLRGPRLTFAFRLFAIHLLREALQFLGFAQIIQSSYYLACFTAGAADSS
jgi:hypothetical protein